MQATGTLAADTGGLDEWLARLERVPQLVAKYTVLIADEARRLAPVDTGTLMNSITEVIEGYVGEVIAGQGITYAGFVEYGTHKMAAQPFLRPAFERHAAAFLAELEAIFA